MSEKDFKTKYVSRRSKGGVFFRHEEPSEDKPKEDWANLRFAIASILKNGVLPPHVPWDTVPTITLADPQPGSGVELSETD